MENSGKILRKKVLRKMWRLVCAATIVLGVSLPLFGQPVSLQALVTPSTTIMKNGRPVVFAVHGFIEFKSLAELFPYITSQTQRWNVPGGLNEEQRRQFADELLRRGIESRVISMEDERPLEALITHTSDELRQALTPVKEPVPAGYGDAFLAVQEKWKHSLNCWSASPSIPGACSRIGIRSKRAFGLYGATYDSTEHFWQAVKYHPDITLANWTVYSASWNRETGRRGWRVWIAIPSSICRMLMPWNFCGIILPRTGCSGFAANWTSWADRERSCAGGPQRGTSSFRFSSFEEKVLGRSAPIYFTSSTPSLNRRSRSGLRSRQSISTRSI